MRYPIKFDHAIAGALARLPDQFSPIMNYASIIGGSIYAISTILLVGGWAIVANQSELLTYTVATALFIPLAELLKFITRRQRPETLYAKNMRFKSYSFPSGHAYVSALISSFLAVILIMYAPEPFSFIGVFCVTAFSILIGTSRIYLGAHFPSDVVAGWILGVLVSLSINLLVLA